MRIEEQEFEEPVVQKKQQSNQTNEPKGHIQKAIFWVKNNVLLVGATALCVVGLGAIFLGGPSRADKLQQASEKIKTDIDKYSEQNNTAAMINEQKQSNSEANETTQQTDEQLKEFVQQNQAQQNTPAFDGNNSRQSGENLELIWKKKTLLLFKNPNDSYFLLDQEIPSLVASNFKQDPNNQNRISGHNAKIASISFIKPERNEDFLEIKLVIESIDGEKYTITKTFPILKYVDLSFYEDCVIKTSANGDESILVKGDYIFPYMKIAAIGKRSDGVNIIRLEIYQENFGGPNFIYDYEVK